MKTNAKMEHVVSRADLLDTGSSPTPSPEPDALERFRALGRLDFVASTKTEHIDAGSHGEDGAEDELEFQLFAAPTKATETGDTHKIRLKSPSLDPERTGFLRRHRSQDYYFTSPLTKKEKRQLQSVALQGDQVLKNATSPWPGSAYAWKVLHLPPSGISKDLRTAGQPVLPKLTGAQQLGKKRTRPGKKYRLKLRQKATEGARKKEERKKVDEEKEAAEREKRTRRNREKKVKKKAKEKAKKEEGRDEGTGNEAAGG